MFAENKLIDVRVAIHFPDTVHISSPFCSSKEDNKDEDTSLPME